MLVLSRKPGERLTIGKDIVIVYLGLRNGQARIGIEAPKDQLVLRDEIYIDDDDRERGRS